MIPPCLYYLRKGGAGKKEENLPLWGNEIII